MGGTGRILLIICIIGWYFLVREWVVGRLLPAMGENKPIKRGDFSWYWSFVMAGALTVGSLMVLLMIVGSVLPWIFEGFK